MSNAKTSAPILQVVGAAIVRGRTCLAAQRSSRMSEPGKWEFPGGKVEPGERPEDALRREVLEELDLEIEIGPWLGCGSSISAERRISLQVYVAYPRSTDIQLREHRRYLWGHAEELLQLDWAAADLPIVPLLISWLERKRTAPSVDR